MQPIRGGGEVDYGKIRRLEYNYTRAREVPVLRSTSSIKVFYEYC